MCDRFKAALDLAIQRHVPIEKRYVWPNQVPFMNKKINKKSWRGNFPKRSFLNTKNDIDRKAYNMQRNLFVSWIRSEKENFFNNINISDITDNETFWETKSKITLMEKKLSPSKVKRK